MGKQYYIYLLSGLVILLILKSTFAHFRGFLLKDATVVGEVVDLIFHCLARDVFSLLALVLIIKAFLAYTLGMAVSTAFLLAIYERVFFITVVGTVLVLKPISLLSLTLLGVALCLYLNTFNLCLGRLSLSSSIPN